MLVSAKNIFGLNISIIPLYKMMKCGNVIHSSLNQIQSKINYLTKKCLELSIANAFCKTLGC